MVSVARYIKTDLNSTLELLVPSLVEYHGGKSFSRVDNMTCENGQLSLTNMPCEMDVTSKYIALCHQFHDASTIPILLYFIYQTWWNLYPSRCLLHHVTHFISIMWSMVFILAGCIIYLFYKHFYLFLYMFCHISCPQRSPFLPYCSHQDQYPFRKKFLWSNSILGAHTSKMPSDLLALLSIG